MIVSSNTNNYEKASYAVRTTAFFFFFKGLLQCGVCSTGDPGFVWDQTMLLHQMAMDSDLLGQDMCSKWRKGEDVSHDFHWAQHFRVVPQHVQHSVGSVGGWDRGASISWNRGA